MASPTPATPSSVPSPLRVGLVSSEKKFRTFFNGFMAAVEAPGLRNRLRCHPYGLTACSDALDRGDPYPPTWRELDAILHKCSDDIAASGLAVVVDTVMDGRPHREVELQPRSPGHDDYCCTTSSSSSQGDAGEPKAFYAAQERHESRSTVVALQRWESENPARRVVYGSLAAAELTTRRTLTQAAVLRALAGVPAVGGFSVRVPFASLVQTPESEREELARWRGTEDTDLMVKSDVACGKRESHHMRLVASSRSQLTSPTTESMSIGSPVSVAASPAAPVSPSKPDLAAVQRFEKEDDGYEAVCPPPFPRVIQRVVVDAAYIYKMYVLGERLSIRVVRNTIPWIPKSSDGWFSSQRSVYFPVETESRSLPLTLDSPAAADITDYEALPSEQKASLETWCGEGQFLTRAAPFLSNPRNVHAICIVGARLRRGLDMDLFGFDLAVGTDASATPGCPSIAPTPAIHVLDVNYFPSFKGIDDVYSVVAGLVEDAVARRRRGCPPPRD